MRTFLILLGAALLLGTGAAAADLKISNRVPNSDEVGYRPADGATVPLNPPSFIWLHEKDAASYAIQWAPQADFREAQTVTGFVWNTYTHNAPLEPGTYYWRYRFTAQDGRESDWSVARKVIVPRGAEPFPLPTRAEQRARVPQGHPRLFLRPEDLPRLRAQAKGESARAFRQLKSEADKIIKAGPTPEPEHLGSARDKDDADAVMYWWPNREQTERACIEAETLAFVYLITQEKKYGEAARHWVLHLASWNPDGPTNFRLNCEAAKPMLFRPARAYDWAHDMFTPAERETIQSAMRRRILDAWESGEVRRGTGHLNSPYNSHGNRVWHKIGEAGIAFLGEIPEAETWLDYAMNKFYACYPVWADDDGGWHEGVSYWSGYLSKAVWWLQVMHSALGIDGLKKPFFAKVGDYPLYIAPPGSPNSGFGDLSYRPPSAGVGGFMEYFIRMKGNQADGERAAYWQWWTDQWRMSHSGGVLGFLYSANLPALPDAKPPTELPTSKVFHGIGVASLHTTLENSRDDVHLLFKSSPFGTQSHGHNPHNTFQLNAYGDCLLTTCVYRDLHGSRFHYQWAHSTQAHNGVLVDGEGQTKHSPAPHGQIIESRLTPQLDHVIGDATDAYGGRLQTFRRHLIFVKPDADVRESVPFIVIYDDLEANKPATFQFMLHALQKFELNDTERRLKTEHEHAGVDVLYLSPTDLRFRQWDGFDPPPTQKFPNQWHVEASTTEKQTQLAMLTVIVPYRSGERVDWTAERIETDGELSVRLNMGKVKTTVSIPKSKESAEVRVKRES